MQAVLVAGITIVNLALISYSIAIFTQSRSKTLGRKVLVFLSIGVILDISATICMVIGSGKFLTLHGIIGYTSLSGMLTDTIFSFYYARKYGLGKRIPGQFNKWSITAYLYWVIAYITGALLVMLK
ncbi:MAG: hypothetical protein IPH84_10320 [Bacteroidales bacterium]|nr:hypothetical protein [Bacteroidales bacterium]